MSGPLIVVVAGFVTLGLALSSNDGLVVDDYYKQGKEVNRSFKRDDAARALGLSANVRFDERLDSVHVVLTATNLEQALKSSPLRLTLAHATLAGRDQQIELKRVSTGFAGKLSGLGPGKWHVVLEDVERSWRLQSTMVVGQGPLDELRLRPLAE
jgi:hypothetical protein